MQNNSDKDFSDLLKNKLDNTSLDFNEELWDKTFSKYRQARHSQRRKRALAWIGSVTAVLLVALYFSPFCPFNSNESSNTSVAENNRVLVPDSKKQADNKLDADKGIITNDKDEALASDLTPQTNNTTGSSSTAPIKKKTLLPRKQKSADTKTQSAKVDETTENIKPVEKLDPVETRTEEIVEKESPKLDYVTPSKTKDAAKTLFAIRTPKAKQRSFQAARIRPLLKDKTIIAGTDKKDLPAQGDKPAETPEKKAPENEKPAETPKIAEKGTAKDSTVVAEKKSFLPAIKLKDPADTNNIWEKARMSKLSPYYHAWQLGASIETSESYRSLSERGSGLDTGYIRLRDRAEKATRTHSIQLNVQYNFNRYIGISSGVGFVQSAYTAKSGKYLIYETDTQGNQKEVLHNYSSRVSYNFVSVPLELRVSPIVRKSFSITAFAGVNAMIMLNERGITPSPKDRAPVQLENDNSIVKYNQYHFTATYGFAINTCIGKNLQLSIQPSWRRSLNSLYAADMPVDERIKSKGLVLGINYGF